MRIWDRRIGRVGFVVGYLVLVAVAYWIWSEVPDGNFHLQENPVLIGKTAVLAFLILMLSAWRCHDYGESLWSNFVDEQVPVVGGFLALWDLVTKPGNPDHNSYGPVPRF